MKRRLMLAILVSLTIVAIAQLPQPHQSYGDVDFLDGPAPNGMLVEAKIDGVTLASTTTHDGRYGYSPYIFYVEDPYGNRAGKTIYFFVNGIDTGETAIFENGASTHLDLTVPANKPLTTTTSTSTTSTTSTTTTIIDCIIYNPKITSNCGGGCCDEGDTISMSGVLNGDCSQAQKFQIDASGGGCTIEFSGGDLSGITDSISISASSDSVSGTWTISSLPTQCQGATVYATYGALWEGNPGASTRISQLPSPIATGSIEFCSATETTTTTIFSGDVPGDTDGDGDVSDIELLIYIEQWAQGLVSDINLLIAIEYWAT